MIRRVLQSFVGASAFLVAAGVAAATPAQELGVARDALRDGLWAIAENHAALAAKDPAVCGAARLVLLEALAREGRDGEILARLDDWGDPPGEGFRYWRIWALDRTQQPRNAQRLAAVPFADPVYAVLADRLSARIATELRDRAGAERLFRKVAAATNESVKAANAVEWARALDGFGDAAAARVVLKDEGAVDAAGEAGDEARLLAAGLDARAGRPEGAEKFWKKLVAGGSNTAERAFVAAATELSRTAWAAARTNDAVALARSAVARATGAEPRRLAGFLLGSELLADPATRAEGVSTVKALVREFPEADESRAAQLGLADSLLALGDPSAAATEYRVFLETYPAAAMDARVLEGRGWALLQLGRRTEALGMFARAAQMATNDDERATCVFKQGDALLADGRYDEAATMYAGVATRFPKSPLAERAMFQEADCLSRAGKDEDAAAGYRRVVDRRGALANEAALRLAAFDSAAGRAEAALATYDRILKENPDNVPLAVEARVGRGRAYYRAYRFEEAAKDFTAVAESVPARRDEMRFLATLCLYGQGRDTEAKTEALAVLKAYPDSPIRPDLVLWLAKFDFNHGDYAAAQAGFESYASSWPSGAHAAEALVWAARAASARADYTKAVELVTRAVKAYPGSPSLVDGQLVQSEALIELARFDEAVLVLERVILAAPDSAAARQAGVLKADCLFAMGADNDARYQEALAAYRAVLRNEKLSPNGQLAVSFKIGRTLEKMKRTEEAMDQYYTQVVLAYRDARAKGAWFDDTGRTFFARAAFALADYYESRGDDAQAARVLRQVVSAGVPAADEAVRRIGRLNAKGRLL